MYDASNGNLGLAACRWIFRNNVQHLGSFSISLCHINAFSTELNDIMYAIEVTYRTGWNKLWVKCDFKIVVPAFNKLIIVSWRLQNKWHHCISITSNMR